MCKKLDKSRRSDTPAFFFHKGISIYKGLPFQYGKVSCSGSRAIPQRSAVSIAWCAESFMMGQSSSRWCGMKVWRVPAQVSSHLTLRFKILTRQTQIALALLHGR
ncbi:hypothetical protein AVEN_150568-1 [Araneus ventricosus]|uniref:Uncharacterized protein n=1 Tax=Araneus ventricosus TaxID=182803 RepID=A0A4Y2PKF4_ARAVE|nr:hypothetical protein AVEN_150568-1 [Araneus ventricosus]